MLFRNEYAVFFSLQFKKSIKPKYEKCPDCGSTTIGNGQCGVIVEDDTVTRICNCVFKTTIDKYGMVIK